MCNAIENTLLHSEQMSVAGAKSLQISYMMSRIGYPSKPKMQMKT